MFPKTFLKGYTFSFAILMFTFLSCSNGSENKNMVLEIPDSLIQKTKDRIFLKKPMGDLEKALIDQGLVNIQKIDSTLLVDLKYSTNDNFFGRDVYGDLENAYLPEDVARKLKNANAILKENSPDFRLLIFDAVRSHSVQKILWDALDSIPPNTRKAYVADPEMGSLHNYGCAVDLSIYDLKSDSLLDMGTSYDYFGILAYPRMEEDMMNRGLLNENQLLNRKLLRSVMKKAGFFAINSEWWHFNSSSLAAAKREYPLIK